MVALLTGCGDFLRGWHLDYGTPNVQILQSDLAKYGNSYVGKHITVKGVVTNIDLKNPEIGWIELEHGIRCGFPLPDFKPMINSVSKGETVYVDGYLKGFKKNEITIEPSILRDPKAPFKAHQF